VKIRVSIKETSVLFCAIVLVAGTFAAISPSFIKGVNAQPESYKYGMDHRYSDYNQDYDIDRYDKKPYENNYYDSDYGKDSYEKKSYGNSYEQDSYSKDRASDKYNKDNSNNVSLKKLKCNNINANLNNINASFGSPIPSDDTEGGTNGESLAAQGDEAISANSLMNGANNGDRSFVDRENNFAFVCLNNNNNIVAGEGNATEPTGTLAVTKTVTCTPRDTLPATAAACQTFLSNTLPSFYDITVSGNNPNPSEFAGSNDPVVVTLGAGNYEVSEDRPNEVEPAGFFLSLNVRFSGDCTDALPDVPLSGEATGTIAAGESQVCNISNDYGLISDPQPGGLTSSNTNTGSQLSSFSQPTIAQGTEEDLSAMEKITKLKTQWLDLLP
jgi:hypothetical protein